MTEKILYWVVAGLMVLIVAVLAVFFLRGQIGTLAGQTSDGSQGANRVMCYSKAGQAYVARDAKSCRDTSRPTWEKYCLLPDLYYCVKNREQ